MFVGVLCWSLFWYLLCVFSSFAIIMTGKRELVAMIDSSFLRLVTVNVLWLTAPPQSAIGGSMCDCVFFLSYSLFCRSNLHIFTGYRVC